MKTITFLLSALLFLIIGFSLTYGEQSSNYVLLVAPVFAFAVVKLRKYRVIEGQALTFVWVTRSILFGLGYGLFKVVTKFILLGHVLAPEPKAFEQLLQTFFLAILFMPLLEEFFFRGILFDDFCAVYGNSPA